ncbi:hypothetical protein ES703_74954 [subsurface metagenome]
MWKSPGNNGRAIWSAQWVGTVASSPPHTLFSQFVEVGSLHQLVMIIAMTERAVSPLVSQDKQYVRAPRINTDFQSLIRQHRPAEGGYVPAQRCLARCDCPAFLQKFTSIHNSHRFFYSAFPLFLFAFLFLCFPNYFQAEPFISSAQEGPQESARNADALPELQGPANLLHRRNPVRRAGHRSPRTVRYRPAAIAGHEGTGPL